MDGASRSSDERRASEDHSRLHQHRSIKLQQHFERARNTKSKIQFALYALPPIPYQEQSKLRQA